MRTQIPPIGIVFTDLVKDFWDNNSSTRILEFLKYLIVCKNKKHLKYGIRLLSNTVVNERKISGKENSRVLRTIFKKHYKFYCKHLINLGESAGIPTWPRITFVSNEKSAIHLRENEEETSTKKLPFRLSFKEYKTPSEFKSFYDSWKEQLDKQFYPGDNIINHFKPE